MIITNCPRCGAMNATTTCTKCGWSQFNKSTVSTRITGEIELMLSGKALLDDYKRLLLENRNLKERVAELKESDKHWAGNVKVCMQLIERYESAIAELEAAQRWIPVSERLPECEKDVLVFWGKALDGSKIDWFGTAWRNDSDDGKWCTDPIVPTHWMPLPSVPESEDK